MKRVLHSTLLVLGFLAWFLGVLLVALSAGLAVLGERVLPSLMYGNCWTYVMTKYWHGGYLIVRRADDVRFLGRFQIPHVIWCQSLPTGMEVQHFVPTGVRSKAKWLPWRTIWYEGEVRRRERKRPGEPQPDTGAAELLTQPSDLS